VRPAFDTLEAALNTLQLDETPTIRDVPRLFDDLEYRYGLLSRQPDSLQAEFWRRFDQQPPSQQGQLSYPAIHRVRGFYSNPTLYPVLCHPDGLDFAKFISENKIVLVSLHVNQIKVPAREQRFLGAVLLSQIQIAAMNSPSGRSPFYVYIDEVQEFVTTSLDEMFTQARKFGLGLTVAHQFLGNCGHDAGGHHGCSRSDGYLPGWPEDARTLSPMWALSLALLTS
jgi:hypothetical protein